MLNLLRKANKLYEFIVPVTAGAACAIKVDPDIGKVVCYAAAENEEKARDLTVMELQIARCTIQAGWQSREIDHKNWGNYIRMRWPRSYTLFQNPQIANELVKESGVFIAPVDLKNG